MTETGDEAPTTLYYAPRSRAQTALWLLEELGIPYRLESFALSSGRHKRADYLALNPMGKVPLVVDHGVPVAETGAIAVYLADRYPAAALAPSLDAPTRPAYLRWCFFAAGVFEPALADRFFGARGTPSQLAWGSFEQMATEVMRGTAEAAPFLLGERFSAADVLIGAALSYATRFGAMPREGSVGAYLDRVQARPAYQRASAIEARESERFPMPTPS